MRLSGNLVEMAGLAVLLIGILLLWRHFRYPLRIVITQSSIESTANVPGLVRKRLQEFAETNLQENDRHWLYGYWDNSNRIQWKVPASWDRELAQRFRIWMTNEV